VATPYATRRVIPEPAGSTPGFPWRAVAIAAFVGCFALYLWVWLVDGAPAGAVLLVLPALVMLSAPVFLRASRTERSFDLAGLMATGLALRFAALYYRWLHGQDGHGYNWAGVQLARSFRALHFDVDTGAPVPGTGGLRYISGLVSIPVGTDELVKYCVFTWFGFWGCVLLYRAFASALPHGDRYRYARLIFLWPSLIFWPSSIGKEAWMMLTLGVAMVGAARVFTRRSGGYTLLVLGLGAGSFVRPHVALIALLAFSFALMIGRRHTEATHFATPAGVAKVAGLVVALLLGGVLVTRTQELLDPTDTQNVSLTSTGNQVQAQTAEGNSQYTPSDPKTPVGYVVGSVTVLFRPFPFEANGLEALMAAAEGLALAVLVARSWRRLRSIPRRLRDEPYYALALAFVPIFIYGFASVANFGILARERVQLLPFLFVLLAAPASARAVRRPRRGALATDR
jgi:hypothetical protein